MKSVVSWLIGPLESAKEIRDKMFSVELQSPPPQRSFVAKKPIKKSEDVYAPQKFDDYIGQVKAKSILKRYIKASKANDACIPHMIIHGNAGCGKTTLARIMAKELGVKFAEVIATTCGNVEDILAIIRKAKGGIVFLDEVHGLKRKDAESLYSVMEDFKYNGKKIKPFTLIGATTEYGELLRNRKPFVDRFKINLELSLYTPKDLEEMVRKYKKNAFPTLKILDEAYEVISRNSKLTPRMAIRLLDSTAYFDGDYKMVLENFNIVKDSYTCKDIKAMEYLKNIKSAGVDSIATFLNTPKQSYLYEVEPYLLQTAMIVRGGTGRRITDKGISFLASLP